MSRLNWSGSRGIPGQGIGSLGRMGKREGAQLWRHHQHGWGRVCKGREKGGTWRVGQDDLPGHITEAGFVLEAVDLKWLS